MRYRGILAEEAQFPVTMMCRLVEVSRSGYYAWRRRPESKRAKENRRLLVEIRAVHEENRRVYGSPRVHFELQARGIEVGRHRVARLMSRNGIVARQKRRFRRTTDSKHPFPVAPNTLNRDFRCEEPNRRWTADITYLWTREGWLYLAVILDLYSRYVVGWATGSRIDGDLTRRALRQALAVRNPAAGLLHHSDRGVQYACREYRALLQTRGIECSMSRKGNCWDNAVTESLLGTLKTELVDHADWHSREQAHADLFEYLEVFYNRKRRHSALGFLSPAEYERNGSRKQNNSLK